LQQIVYFKITAHLKNLHYYYYYHFFLYKFIRPISLDIRLGRVPQRNLRGLLEIFYRPGVLIIKPTVSKQSA